MPPKKVPEGQQRPLLTVTKLKNPPRKTEYTADLCKQTDDDGHEIGTWLQKGKDEYHGYCKVCKADFAIDGSGVSQVKSHSKSQAHKKKFKDTFQGQTRLTGETVFVSERDKVTTAELIWLFKLIAKDVSFVFSDGMSDTFRAMFPDSDIAKSFGMGRTKISYLIRFGVGPYFSDDLGKDIGKSAFSIIFDDSTNRQIPKQMDVIIRYYSESTCPGHHH